MLPKLRYFIPLGVAITLIYGFIYASIQQTYRQSANDPQIEYSEQLASALATGVKMENPQEEIDISKYLTQFVIIYNRDGKVTYTSAVLNNKTPILPKGVLDYAKEHGQNRVTWEPKPGVRIASIVTSYQSTDSAGFVLVGRNLREVEMREETLTIKVALAWIITLVATLASTVIFLPSTKKR